MTLIIQRTAETWWLSLSLDHVYYTPTTYSIIYGTQHFDFVLRTLYSRRSDVQCTVYGMCKMKKLLPASRQRMID